MLERDLLAYSAKGLWFNSQKGGKGFDFNLMSNSRVVFNKFYITLFGCQGLKITNPI